MSQWEYLEIVTSGSIGDRYWSDNQGRSGRLPNMPPGEFGRREYASPLLNQLGAMGWELVSVTPRGDYIFKRPRGEERT